MYRRCGIQRHLILLAVGLAIVGGEHQRGHSGSFRPVAVIGPCCNRLGIPYLHIVGQRILVRILKDASQIQLPRRVDGDINGHGILHTLLNSGRSVLCRFRNRNYFKVVIILLSPIVNAYCGKNSYAISVISLSCNSFCIQYVLYIQRGSGNSRFTTIAFLGYTQFIWIIRRGFCQRSVFNFYGVHDSDAHFTYYLCACQSLFVRMNTFVVGDFYVLHLACKSRCSRGSPVIKIPIFNFKTLQLRPVHLYRRCGIIRCIRFRCGNCKEAHRHEQAKEQ